MIDSHPLQRRSQPTTGRTPDTRLSAAAGALATCVALAVYPAVAGRPLIALLLPGGAAALLLAISLATGWAAAIPWALGMLGGEYMVSVYVRGGWAVTAAAVYGSGLLLLAELAYWWLERQTPGHDEARLTLRRVLAVTLLVLGSLGLGLLVATVTQTGGVRPRKSPLDGDRHHGGCLGPRSGRQLSLEAQALKTTLLDPVTRQNTQAIIDVLKTGELLRTLPFPVGWATTPPAERTTLAPAQRATLPQESSCEAPVRLGLATPPRETHPLDAWAPGRPRSRR